MAASTRSKSRRLPLPTTNGRTSKFALARVFAVINLTKEEHQEAPFSVHEALRHSVRNTRIVVTHYGGPDALQVIEEDCPDPKPGEVRVRVQSAGVSLPDL